MDLNDEEVVSCVPTRMLQFSSVLTSVTYISLWCDFGSLVTSVAYITKGLSS